MEDININDLIRFAINQVGQHVSNGAIENLFGDTLDYPPKEKDIAFGEKDFREFERLLINDVAISIYKLIVSNPIVLAVAMSKGKVSRPSTIKDYTSNIQILHGDLKNFGKEMDTAVARNEDGGYIVFRTEENRASFRQFLKFMNNASLIFPIAVKAEKVCLDKKLSDLEFLKIVCEYNKKIAELLENSFEKIDNLYVVGPGFDIMLTDFINNFKTNIQSVEQYKTMVLDEENAKKQTIAVKPAAIASQISPKEQERIEWINKANDLYNQLCVDFMRDLEKQVPQSTRDMYRYFIDVKFAGFVKRFQPPLSNSATVGMAKEAYSQINKLMDYITEISKNSYTISVYGND